MYVCLWCEAAHRHPQGRSRLQADQEALGKLKQRTVVVIMGFISISFSEYEGYRKINSSLESKQKELLKKKKK